jgi:hydrogenase-4 component B
MISFYWIVTLCFLLTGVIWAVWIKRKGLAVGWALIALLCLLDVAAGFKYLLSGVNISLGTWGQITPFGQWTWRLDGLSAYFLALLGVLGFLVSVYNAAHAAKGNEVYGTWALTSVAVQYFFTNILLVAHNALPMLIAWEGMSITAFSYVLTNHLDSKTRRSAFLTIVFSEIGFLALVIALLLPGHISLSMDFASIAANLKACPSGIQLAVLILAFVGFGVKSGFIPVQFWLPRAYLVVPGNLGALLAGSLVNLGVFGILRVYFNWFSGQMIPDGFAVALLLIGGVGIFLGALYAAIVRNLKHILGYSSIENTSFMLLDMGLVILFNNHGLKLFAGLAFTALLILMVSHGFAKALAFLDVGEIEKTTGTTNLDHLGGLSRKMPAVSRTFLVACLSLATVAPFSGFTAEWLGLQSMFQIYRVMPPMEKVACTASIILVAMGSALALTAFLRAYTYTFTGRSRIYDNTLNDIQQKLPTLARGAMAVLACLCALVGFFPTLLLSLLTPMENAYFKGIVGSMVPNVFQHYLPSDLLPKLGGRIFSFLPIPGPEIQPTADGIASIAPMYLLLWFIVIAFLAWVFIKALRRPYPPRKARAWLGGNTGYGPQSQYSATAFSNTYRMLFSNLLNFRVIRQDRTGTLPSPIYIQVRTWTRQVLSVSPYEKFLVAIRKKVKLIARIQHGHLFGYVAYVLFYMLLVLLIVRFAY